VRSVNSRKSSDRIVDGSGRDVGRLRAWLALPDWSAQLSTAGIQGNAGVGLQPQQEAIGRLASVPPEPRCHRSRPCPTPYRRTRGTAAAGTQHLMPPSECRRSPPCHPIPSPRNPTGLPIRLPPDPVLPPCLHGPSMPASDTGVTSSTEHAQPTT
jgi:hypothetical protein